MSEPKKRVFYFAMNDMAGNLQVPIGGGKHTDGQGKIIYAPFKLIKFNNGRFTTDDPEMLGVLEKLCEKWPASGVTEDHEQYLEVVLSEKRKADRNKARVELAEEEINRLRDELAGANKQLAKAKVAPPKGKSASPPSDSGSDDDPGADDQGDPGEE